jgi:hypothetical protein
VIKLLLPLTMQLFLAPLHSEHRGKALTGLRVADHETRCSRVQPLLLRHRQANTRAGTRPPAPRHHKQDRIHVHERARRQRLLFPDRQVPGTAQRRRHSASQQGRCSEVRGRARRPPRHESPEVQGRRGKEQVASSDHPPRAYIQEVALRTHHDHWRCGAQGEFGPTSLYLICHSSQGDIRYEQ